MHLFLYFCGVFTLAVSNVSRTSHLETIFVGIRRNRSLGSNFWHQIPVTCLIMMKEQEEYMGHIFRKEILQWPLL